MIRYGVHPVWLILLFVMWGGISYGMMVSTDHITINIEHNNLDELIECNSQVSDLQTQLENTQPICPACECNCNDGSDFSIYLLGAILGAALTIFALSNANYIKDKLKKKKKVKRAKTSSKTIKR